MSYTPQHKVRIVTAASLFDGHDAAINIMRRIMQSKGAEIIHLGHNRSVHEIVECAIEEDVQGIAITSYQGGHVEFFKYMKDLLVQNGCAHIKIFGGGGGTILPEEIDELVVEDVAEEVVLEEVETNITSIHEEQVGMSDHPSTDAPVAERMAEVVQLFGNKRREATITPVVTPAPTPSPKPEPTAKIAEAKPQTSKTPAKTPAKKSVDDLFANLRKTSTADVARTAKPKTVSVEPTETKTKSPKAVVPKVDGLVFERRDEVLAPIMVALTSKIKRVLADEENSMLTYLQGKKAAVALEKVLPEPSVHVQGYIEAVAEDVMSAAMGGAKSLSSSLKADLRRKVTSSAVMQVMSKNIDDVLVRPLRDRIQRCVEQSDGDREEMSKLIRSVYREWKMQRVEQHIGDIARLAYSRGAYLVLDHGTSVCWMVDPNGPPCADAEDNSLAGAIALGTDFPTGHAHPTAHTGCRCLVTPTGD